MRKHLRSATALALVTGLAAPGIGWSQDLPVCEEGVDLPCTTDNGNTVETAEALEVYLETVEEGAEAELDLEQAPVEELPVVDVPAEGEDAADAEDAAADPVARALPECEEGVDLPCVTDEGNTVETTEALDVYLENVEEGAEAEIDPEQAPVEDLPVVDAPVVEEDAAEEPPEAEEDAGDADPADEAEPEAAETPAEAPEDAATAADPAAAEPEVTEAPAADGDPQADEPASVAAEDPVPEDSIESDIPVVESEVPEEAAAAEEPPLAAAAAAAEEGATAPPAEVEEMTVTDEMARSSTEEFATAIGEEAPAATAEEDEGPSRLERAVALGIGAAVLGTILEQGSEVVSDTGDRLVVRQRDGDLRVIRDDDVLLRQPGADVRTETFDDGSSRTTVTRDDGSRIVTIRAADGEVLRRTRLLPDGRRVVLFDQTERAEPVDTAALPAPTREAIEYTGDEAALRAALAQAVAQDVGRDFSLRQIREIREVRNLAPEIEIDEINFPSGSAVIQPGQAQQLAALGRTLAALIEENPRDVFLVEGHTDAVGDASYNLALSDRRAESVALALTEYFDVPPENLVVQGYGESDLKVPTAGPERENRRANIRRITGLLGGQTAALR